MRCNITVRKAFIVLVLVDILIEDLDDWEWRLVVFAQGHKVLHSLPIVLQDAIKVY